MRFFWLPTSLLILFPAVLSAQKPIYSSEKYSVFPNKVVQSGNWAEIVNPSHIRTNYKSPASETVSRRVFFKVSINEKDNEMPPGMDHWVDIHNEHKSPIEVFGKCHPVPKDLPPGFLPVNYPFTFRIDLRPVLKSFEQKGYFETWQGQRIAKADFKGFFLAGSSEPLTWDFVNLSNHNLQLHDDDGDGIYEISVILNPYNANAHDTLEWKQALDLTKYPQYSSNQPISDALFNLSLEEAVKAIEPDSTFRTGAKWGGVWTRDISYSIVLAFALHEPEIAKNSLLRKVSRKRIIQDTGSGGAWPVSSDRMTWAMAAWELYSVTGDTDWLSEAYEIIKNSVEDDEKNLQANASGLRCGESSFLDWREQSYPKWMQNADIYQSENLGTNVVHYQALRILSRMARELKEPYEGWEKKAEALKSAINEHFWMSDKGYYAQFRYGRAYPLISPRAEALGEALAILTGVADSSKTRAILKNVPLMEFGIPCFFPQIPGIPPYHNNAIWPFVQSYWNLAAAKGGNASVLNHGIASVYRAAALFLTNYENMVASTGDFHGTEINSHRMLWSMAGNLSIVYRIFLGMHFEPKGIRFAPVIPKEWAGSRSLKNLTYRDAVLSIQVNGWGNKVKKVMLDGKVLEKPFLPGDLKGQHQLVIDMEVGTLYDMPLAIKPSTFSLSTPQIIYAGRLLRWNEVEGASYYKVFHNSHLIETVHGVTAPMNGPGEYQVAACSDHRPESFLSEPVLIFPEENAIRIPIPDTTGEPELCASGYKGSGYCESTIQKNTVVNFEINAPQNGWYRLDIRYANGSGPWNTDNKCAIRTLSINGINQGAMVFPQRGKQEWSDWGFSNVRWVKLEKGLNYGKLELLQENTNMNEEVNTVLLNYVRCVLIK